MSENLGSAYTSHYNLKKEKTMGLYSDYMEEWRWQAESVDSCKIARSWWSAPTYDQCYQRLNEYSDLSGNTEYKKALRDEFVKNAGKLEALKSDYLIAEKAIYEVQARYFIKSELISTILQLLLEQVKQSYQRICELRRDIDRKISKFEITGFENHSENLIRQDMLKRVINSVLLYMNNGTISETSECRKVVSDCAELIRCLEDEDYNMPDKKVLSYYIERTFQINRGSHRCSNCKQLLYENIPYCLNCYERNL